MSDVNLTISRELVKPILEAKIQSAILNQLVDGQKLMETLVSKTLLEKVGPDGKTDSYYSKDRTWLEYLCQDAIKTATVAAVREAAEKLGPDLKRLVSAELVKRKERRQAWRLL